MSKNIATHRLVEYIDAYGTAVMLNRVAEVCRSKAEQLRAAHHDSESAAIWEKQARSIEYAAELAKERGI